MGQILFYDENEMRAFDCSLFDIQPPERTELDITGLEDMTTQSIIRTGTTATASVVLGEVKAALDPTTMKRIAKYNLDKDFEELNRKIKTAEERLESLNKEAEEKEQKLGLIMELFPKIWDDPNFDQDNYLPDEDDDYEEDWE